MQPALYQLIVASKLFSHTRPGATGKWTAASVNQNHLTPIKLLTVELSTRLSPGLPLLTHVPYPIQYT